jgi:type I restriction enzyme S subunit
MLETNIPKDVPMLRIGDVAHTTSGTTPSRSVKRYWHSATIPWVKTGEISFEPIRQTEEAVSEEAVRECCLPLLPIGTVLIAMYGQGKTRAQSAVLEIEATTNQACFAILPCDAFLPEYLQYWFQATYRSMRDLSDGRGGNQANLNGVMLRELHVPWINRDRQKSRVDLIRRKFSEVKTARTAAKEQLREVSALSNAIYREAFRSVTPIAVPPVATEPPNGWRWRKLTDIARLESGHTPSRLRPDWWGGDISWLSLTEIRALDGTWVDQTQLRTNP